MKKPKKEIWKPVVGYEGLYVVSNFGNVKRCARDSTYLKRGRQAFVHYDEMLIKPLVFTHTTGPELRVFLTKDGTVTTKSIKRLVAIAFIPNPENHPYVKLIDSDPYNVSVSNLQWISRSECQRARYQKLKE